MTPEEQKAYARGYAAGRRKRKAERDKRTAQAQRAAFEQRAFLAMLPFVMGPEFNWGERTDDKFVRYWSQDERIDFAWKTARIASARGHL